MSHLINSLLVTLAFALLGWAVGGVTVGGAAAGFVIAFLLFYGIGSGAFAVLFAVFAITWVTTRLGSARKQRLGIAERRHGRRTVGQVLANLGVGGAFAAFVVVIDWVLHTLPLLRGLGIVAAIAALAEAAADTSSSECGEAFSDTAFLVPRFRRVPAGTDGAITLFGSLAGLSAATLVAVVAATCQVLSVRAAAIAGTCGFLGTFVDTALGATLERQGILDNNAVNFSSTFAAAVIALAAAKLLN